MKDYVGMHPGRKELEEDLIEFALDYANKWSLENPNNTTIKTTWMRDAIYTAVHSGGLHVIKQINKMNKIETLPKSLVINKTPYEPKIYITAWDKWCIGYFNQIRNDGPIFSVTVDPDQKPLEIMETRDNIINNLIGNAKSTDDAVDMIINYIKEEYSYEEN